MKTFLVCLNLIALLSPAIFAATVPPTVLAGIKIRSIIAQQNLIGEVSSIDQTGGKIVIQTDAKSSVTVSFSDKTIFRRVMPGETSLANAETIKITDLKIGDRVLIPGFAAGEENPVKQIVVMARAAIEQSRNEDLEKRRARTTVGRIITINAEKREITLQTRGRGTAETVIVDASANAKLRRYAPDSLKLSDAVAGSFTDLRVGDQIRVVGDRSVDGARISAEEIISGSVSRTVGTVTQIDPTRGEVVIKNNQTGQTITAAIGKNTTLRRITPEVAASLKERFERRNARRREQTSTNPDRQSQTQTDEPRNRERRRRERNGSGQSDNRRQLFENLPAITIADLKKGDAVLIVGTNAGGADGRMTAVSIIAGDGELQQILMRTQGGGRGSNMSPGLPGNVSGGNAGGDDDEPER
jgi:sRNA-binding protein